MARIRTIKPEFWSSEQVIESSISARLLFIGLWNFCDDCGRHGFSPKQIKARIFPADNFSEADISRMLDELSSNGLIEVYDVENKRYLQITGWHHQKIDRPQKAKCPAPIKSETNVRRMLVGGKDRIGKEEGNAPELSSSLRSEEVLTHSSTSGPLTTENQEKSKSKKRRSSAHTELIDRVADEWDSIAHDFRLAAIRVITDRRETAVLARAKELVSLYDFPDPLAGFKDWGNKIRGSPFLRGEKGWRPTFDFAIKQENFTKIMEGAYDPQENRRGEYNSFSIGGNNRR